MYAMNALTVEVVFKHPRGIDEAQKLLAGLRMYPEIDTEKSGYGDLASGFLHCFTNHGFLGGLTALDMATRLGDNENTG